jgi:hypothetical protein
MNFLRAESGWFLYHAYSAPEMQQRFVQSFWRGSHGGHYTPRAFLAEFETAKIAGTNESIRKTEPLKPGCGGRNALPRLSAEAACDRADDAVPA